MNQDTIHALAAPDLVRIAVLCAIKQLKTTVTDQDLEDMIQAAWLRVWIVRDKSESYQFITARNEALTYFYRYCLESTKKATLDPWTPIGSLEQWKSDAGDLDLSDEKPLVTWTSQGKTQPEARTIPIDQTDLAIIMASTYRSYYTHARPKAINAGKKDALVLMLLLQGYNNRGIAQEMGIKPRSVVCRRSKIRKKLETLL